jgi:hypothetical protein
MSGGYRSLLPPKASEIDTSSDVEDPNQISMSVRTLAYLLTWHCNVAYYTLMMASI